jgi:hypothetical protein
MRMQESTKLATKFSLNPDPRTLTPKLQASRRKAIVFVIFVCAISRFQVN